MKKISAIIIIFFSAAMSVNELLYLLSGNELFEKLAACSFIGLGLGAILIGIAIIKENRNVLN